MIYEIWERGSDMRWAPSTEHAPVEAHASLGVMINVTLDTMGTNPRLAMIWTDEVYWYAMPLGGDARRVIVMCVSRLDISRTIDEEAFDAPTLTPGQALARLREQDPLTHNGFRYWLDGPQMSEAWWPCARSLDYDAEWVPSGDVGDPIGEDTTWVRN